MSGAQYRLLAPGGQARESGDAEVEVRDGVLVLAPVNGNVMPIPFGRIETVSEPEPYTVRLTLAGGDVVELGRLGVMRTQLLAELRDGRGDAAAAAGAVGAPEIFTAGQGEVRVYDDALLVTGAGGSERVSFSFAGALRVQDYAVAVEVAGRAPVVLTRLGRRTTELADLLTTRIRAAVDELGRRGGLALGFRQLASVRRPATGVEPWHDHAATPHIGEHETAGGAFQPGLAAGMMSGGPGAFGPGGGAGAAAFGPGGGPGAFGYGEGFGEYGAFRALGAGMNSRDLRQMAGRPDVTRGLLTPATENLSALTVTGESPPCWRSC